MVFTFPMHPGPRGQPNRPPPVQESNREAGAAAAPWEAAGEWAEEGLNHLCSRCIPGGHSQICPCHSEIRADYNISPTFGMMPCRWASDSLVNRARCGCRREEPGRPREPHPQGPSYWQLVVPPSPIASRRQIPQPVVFATADPRKASTKNHDD